MSKFTELCESFTKARKNFKEYEAACKELALELWYNLAAYYEIPIDRIAYYHLNEYGVFVRADSQEDWIMVMHEDTYFEFGVGITLYEMPEVFPYAHHTIVLPFLVSSDFDGKQSLLFGSEGKKFEVEKGNVNSYRPILDYVFRILQSEYEEGLSNMKIQNTVRTIGYKSME